MIMNQVKSNLSAGREITETLNKHHIYIDRFIALARTLKQ